MRFTQTAAKVRSGSQKVMVKPRVQWLTEDHSLWEVDWLRFLFKPIQDYIEVEFEEDKIKTDENTVLICNHSVPYRNVLNRLRQEGKKYAIVLLSDENLIEPCEWLHDPHCVGLIRNYINPMLLGHPKVSVFGLGYKIGLVKELQITEKRELVWSFAGTPHKDRATVIEKFKELQPYKVHTCSGFNAADGLNTKEYAELLKNSKYALCPPGQDSMDSFRIYEALEAGCIPVCLKNTGYWHVYPSYWHGVFHGESTLPFVCENTWEDCLSIIKQVEKEGLYEEIQNDCKFFWDKWKTAWQNQAVKLYEKL